MMAKGTSARCPDSIMVRVSLKRYFAWALPMVLGISVLLPLARSQPFQVAVVSSFEELQRASASGARHIVVTDHLDIAHAQPAAAQQADGPQAADGLTFKETTVSITV
jgi:ribosomal protein L1